MLENQVEFCDHLKDKEFDCNRVDGSHDQNPTGLEIHFLWTKRHVVNSKTCTVVTTRHSGGSYFNCVELQNGCLALAHSHLFIPSNGTQMATITMATLKWQQLQWLVHCMQICFHFW